MGRSGTVAQDDKQVHERRRTLDMRTLARGAEYLLNRALLQGFALQVRCRLVSACAPCSRVGLVVACSRWVWATRTGSNGSRFTLHYNSASPPPSDGRGPPFVGGEFSKTSSARSQACKSVSNRTSRCGNARDSLGGCCADGHARTGGVQSTLSGAAVCTAGARFSHNRRKLQPRAR
jgi:hypothetical protein